MPSIYVRQICAQLTANTTVEIHHYLDLELMYSGYATAVPPEIQFLEVVKFQTENNKYVLYVR